MEFGIRATANGVVLALCLSSRVIGNTIKQIRIGDKSLNFVESGQGDPVVLVYSGIQNYHFWDQHLAAFSKNNRVIARILRSYSGRHGLVGFAPVYSLPRFSSWASKTRCA